MVYNTIWNSNVKVKIKESLNTLSAFLYDTPIKSPIKSDKTYKTQLEKAVLNTD